jgi:hypothetical protein
MGTRADYYVQHGSTLTQADWLGSTAWDGQPYGVPLRASIAVSEAAFRNAVQELAETKDHFTAPTEGWPWPWGDSRTTDYAYVFNGDHVDVYCFGRPFDPDMTDDEWERTEKVGVFPDMTSIKNVHMGGKKSGVMVISVGTR